MDSPTANLISILRERVTSLRAEGDLNEALHAATAAVDKAQHALSPNIDSIDAFASVLEIRGDIYRELGRLDLACEDYRQAIDQLTNRPDRLAQLGRIHAVLGAAYDSLGRQDKAADQWLAASNCFEHHDPPLMLDIAAMDNNLGFLYKAAGQLEVAESHFLKALEIVHSQLGPKHEQTATISSNLGALYHAAGFEEQSREMHMIALETRRELFGEDHPDTAQSHNNLALALIDTGDRSLARIHFEKALAGFEALGPEYLEDLETVASNFCQFLRQDGDGHFAEVIENRVSQIIGQELSPAASA